MYHLKLSKIKQRRFHLTTAIFFNYGGFIWHRRFLFTTVVSFGINGFCWQRRLNLFNVVLFCFQWLGNGDVFLGPVQVHSHVYHLWCHVRHRQQDCIHSASTNVNEGKHHRVCVLFCYKHAKVEVITFCNCLSHNYQRNIG